MKFIKKKAVANYFNGEKFPEYICPNIPCGMFLKEEYNYCPYCGQKIIFIDPKGEKLKALLSKIKTKRCN